jgi:elongation factor 1-gamma
LAEEALVLSYVSFANSELLPTLARWFLPLIPGFKDPAPYDFDAVEKGKRASLVCLDKLELVFKGKEWLVGSRPTLADIFVGIMVSRGLQWVLGRAWRETHPATMAHFERFSSLRMVSEVIPKFHLAEVEPLNQQPPAVC